MNRRMTAWLVVAAIVVAAAIAAVVISGNRADAARANRARVELEAEAAKHAAAAEQSRAVAAEKNAQAEMAKQRTKEAEKAIAAEERRQAEAEAEAAAADAERAKAEAEKARSEAQAAADVLAVEKAKAEQATAAADAEKAKAAQAATAAAERAAEREAELALVERNNEAIIAEAKALELRQVNFEQLERDLADYKRALDEREAALHPDLTLNNNSNITWVAERDAEVIGEDPKARRKLKPAPENNLELPRETRQLAYCDKVKRREHDVALAASSNAVVRTLARLYVQALKEDRVVDAEYYRKSIKHYFPTWEYRPEDLAGSQSAK